MPYPAQGFILIEGRQARVVALDVCSRKFFAGVAAQIDHRLQFRGGSVHVQNRTVPRIVNKYHVADSVEDFPIASIVRLKRLVALPQIEGGFGDFALDLPIPQQRQTEQAGDGGEGDSDGAPRRLGGERGLRPNFGGGGFIDLPMFLRLSAMKPCADRQQQQRGQQ